MESYKKAIKKIAKIGGAISGIGLLCGVSFLSGCGPMCGEGTILSEDGKTCLPLEEPKVNCGEGTVLSESNVCLPVAVEPVTGEVQEMREQVSFIVESVDDNFEYGDVVKFDVDKREMKNLAKGEVDVNGKDYKYTERLIVDFKLATGLDKRQYGDVLRLMSENKEAIQGFWHFHKPVPVSEIAEDDDGLVVNIGNKNIRIVDIDINASEMTYQDATEISLLAGKVKNIEGVDIELLSVNQYGIAVIKVGNERLILERGDEEHVDDLQVKYLSGVDDYAKIIAGKDIRKTVPLGGEFEDYADGKLVKYKYFWEMDGNSLENFGYVSNIKWNDVTNKNDQKAPELGEPIGLPNEYGSIVIESVDNANLKTYTIEVEDNLFYLSGPFEFDGEDYSSLFVDVDGKLLDINGDPLVGVGDVELLDSELTLDYSVPSVITVAGVDIKADFEESVFESVSIGDINMVDALYNLMTYRGDVVEAVDKDSNCVDLQIRDSEEKPEATVKLEVTKKEVELVPKEPEVEEIVEEELVVEE